MFNKVLIANRGEIAVRIIQACNDLNIQTVAIYSEADRNALHVQLANETYCIGPPPLKQSYLNMEAILKVAISAHVDAIHPGCGLLAENDEFAALCKQFHIKFIGPSISTIQKMSIKDVGKSIIKNTGVPVVPGSNGLTDNYDEALKVAEEIGFPVIMKATAGNNSKAIHTAYDAKELKEAFKQTKREAITLFGNPGLYIEKYIEKCQLIEVQILADSHGNIFHLGERDSTLQDGERKLLEESPSPAIDQDTRKDIEDNAIKVAEAVNYSGTGSVEFIYDKEKKQFYFLEMNTGIQMEHPVTEMITNIDLIKQQIKIAAGDNIQRQQENINLSGCAMECCIEAKNPIDRSKPSYGRIEHFTAPNRADVRTDTAIYSGCKILHFYDPFIAKLIVHGKDRKEAIVKMKHALQELMIDGVYTTTPFFINLLENERFLRGDYDTDFLQSIV